MTPQPENPEELLQRLIEAERLSAPPEGSRRANWAGLQARQAVPATGGAALGKLGKLIGLAVVVGVGGALVGSLLSGPSENAEARGPRDATAETSADAALHSPRGPAESSSASGPSARPETDEGRRPAVQGEHDSRTEQRVDALGIRGPDPHEPTGVAPTGASADDDDGSPPVAEDPEGEGWDAELRLLQRAEAALRADHPAEALTITEAYRRRWPKGEFIEAIEAARTLARCALGDHDGAREARAEYERAWPRSLYSDRIRQGCTVDSP